MPCYLIAELEEAPPEGGAGDEGGDDEAGGKQNRSEKKARKAMQKLGMKAVPGIFRVTVKKSKSILFVINKPDVYKTAGADTYVIFGEAKVEDLSNQTQSAAADQFRTAPSAASMRSGAGAGVGGAPKAATKPAAPAAAAGGSEDATGLEPKDIELVMSQASVGRNQAIKALKDNDGDIVNAILACSC